MNYASLDSAVVVVAVLVVLVVVDAVAVVVVAVLVVLVIVNAVAVVVVAALFCTKSWFGECQVFAWPARASFCRDWFHWIVCNAPRMGGTCRQHLHFLQNRASCDFSRPIIIHKLKIPGPEFFAPKVHNSPQLCNVPFSCADFLAHNPSFRRLSSFIA